jgi:peptide/nickel transport system permease protein
LLSAPADLATRLPDVGEERGSSREWRTFWRNPLGRLGLALLVAELLFSFLGPVLWGRSPYATDASVIVQAPTALHPLGTDELGRDVLARLMVGGQLSLEVGFMAAIVGMAFGTFYGLASALLGGRADAVLMRIVDIVLALPSLFVLLLLDSIFRPSAVLLVLIIASTSWVGIARLVRAEALSLREREFVEAAQASGAGMLRTLGRHLFPNSLGVILVATSFAVGDAILTVATLSFLGLGLPPPTPNWGEMLSDSLNYIFQGSWWLIYPPGLLIVLVELAVNFIGDALREAFDPRLQGGRAA